ncbi:hypothetical protein SH449x_000047 [Pirellulaceae bacterium SH449]
MSKSWLVGGAGICALFLGGIFLYSYWSQPPVVALSNLRYLQQLRTAVSSQRVDHVNKINQALETLKGEGKLNEQEWNHFQSIIAKALEGKWEAAELACRKWADAQSNRKRDPSDKLEHDHSHAGHSH